MNSNLWMILLVTISISLTVQMQQLAYSSTIEIPTYHPPDNWYGKPNGTEVLNLGDDVTVSAP